MKELDELDLNDEEYISIILLAVENVLIFDQDLAGKFSENEFEGILERI